MNQSVPIKRVTEAITANDQLTRRWKSLFAAGRMAYEAGELRQSESLLARAMELAHELPERSLAENITEIGSAAVLLAARRSTESAMRLRNCISALEVYGDDLHKELLGVALRFNAQALVACGEEREAEKELERSSTILQGLGADAFVQLAYTLSDMGGLLLMQGREGEADHYIVKAMRILGSVLGVGHREYLRAEMICHLCIPQDEGSSVESASDTLMRMEYLYGAKHPNIARAMERYIGLLEQRGDTAKIEEVKALFHIKSIVASRASF